MLFGVLLLVACLCLGVHIAQKMEKARCSEGAVALTFLAIFLIPTVGGTFVAEYPSLIREPSVVTFDESGEPVYHKWGLWTPPWSWNTLEVANVPRGCFPVAESQAYHEESRVYFQHAGNNFSLEFSAGVCLEDPKVFYSVRERRRQGWESGNGISGPFNTVRVLALVDLLQFHRYNKEMLAGEAVKLCSLPGIGDKPSSCPTLAEGALYPYVQNSISPYGFKIHVESTVRLLEP